MLAMALAECGVSFGPLVRGLFLQRDNRFRVRVRLGDEGVEPVEAYLPNPGRLQELLVPGATVLLRPAASGTQRRTAYDLLLIKTDDTWVSLDSRLPNPLVETILTHAALPSFAHYPEIRREVVLGESRLDFLLSGHTPHCWLEVKSVTLVEGETAAFPDAPTERGRRHLRELQTVAESGQRAAVLFVVQREDASRFAPHDVTDPAFGATLRAAAQAGVEVRALRCRVTPEKIQPLDELPVEL